MIEVEFGIMPQRHFLCPTASLPREYNTNCQEEIIFLYLWEFLSAGLAGREKH